MKLKTKIVMSGILLLVAVTSAVSAFATDSKNEISSIDVVATKSQDPIAKEQFILKEYEGYIGIFSPGFEKVPITVTDIEVNTLRQADRELLVQGIYAYSRDEMMQLLEDYGS